VDPVPGRTTVGPGFAFSSSLIAGHPIRSQ
jgi:hypothetical protein